MKLVRDSSRKWEQFVMCELLIPNTPNTFGDVYTEDAIREFMVEFARQGYILDINHDMVDVTNEKWIVVESFQAREGDPQFIKGSWVIGALILDGALWQDILEGRINGFSFQADAYVQPVIIQNLANRQVAGVTEAHPEDGHFHTFVVLLDPLNRPISGGTGITNGHSHRISVHTVTDHYTPLLGEGHNHRYQVISQAGGQ